MEIMARKRAVELGRSTYFTGEPCRRGHISERYTQSGGCCLCVAASSAKHRSEFMANRDNTPAARAKEQLRPLKMRVFEDDCETMLKLSRAVTQGRFPALSAKDVTLWRPTDKQGSTALYQVWAHPDDHALLQGVAVGLFNRRLLDVNEARAEIDKRLGVK